MAFTVQDDAGEVANANAYLLVSELDAYCADRGMVYTGSPSEADKQVAIVKGSDYVDVRYQYLGIQLASGQSTEFPRSNLRDRSERTVNGIPVVVKEACSEYAFRALTATLLPDPTRDATGLVLKSSKVKADVVESEKEFVDGGGFVLPQYPIADRKLLRSGFVSTGGDILRS